MLETLSPKRRAELEKLCARFEKNLDKAGPYLESRGITSDTAIYMRLGVVDEPLDWDSRTVGRLSIPYISRAGILDLRYRCLDGHDCNAEGCARYLGEPGARTRLYHVGSVLRSEQGLAICEGEIDTITLLQLGIPAIGLPGSESWKARYARTLEDGAPFVVFADGDKAGRKLAAKLAGRLRDLRVVSLPEGEDVNSIYNDPAYGADWLLERWRGDEELQ